MFEWIEPNKWNIFFIDYFKSREDDGVEVYEDSATSEPRS